MCPECFYIYTYSCDLEQSPCSWEKEGLRVTLMPKLFSWLIVHLIKIFNVDVSCHPSECQEVDFCVLDASEWLCKDPLSPLNTSVESIQCICLNLAVFGIEEPLRGRISHFLLHSSSRQDERVRLLINNVIIGYRRLVMKSNVGGGCF